MEKETEMDYFKSNVKILQFALKQWKFLGGVAVVAGILAIVFSSPQFIPPKYKSEAVIYPANLGGYSGETRLEQMMQYCESNSIREYIINTFDLYDEYEIDSSLKSSKTIMYGVYDEHVSFDETQFESIRITVSSIDPVKSYRMVQALIEQLTLTIRQTERQKYKEAVDINYNLLVSKKKDVDSLETLIKKYSTEYGILDYLVQTEEVTKGYMKFLLDGKKGKDFEEVKKLYTNLQEFGRIYHDLNVRLNRFNDEYINRLHSYEHSLKDYNKVQTHSYVLVSPEIADKKSYPIRWLIVLLAVAASSFFAFVILLMKGYNNK